MINNITFNEIENSFSNAWFYYGISFFFFFLFKGILFFLWIASLQNIYVSIELCANFRVVPLSSEIERNDSFTET